MRESFQRVIRSHLVERQKPFRGNAYASYVRRDVPELVTRVGHVPAQYKVEGSVGKGNWSEVPWIGIFDKDVTTSAQYGYYMVYLFQADMGGFYLSLGLGWTQFENEYGTKVGYLRIRDAANVFSRLLKSPLNDFSDRQIELRGKKTLAKGYEKGCFCSKFYSADFTQNDAELAEDLRNLIGVYRELKGYISGRSVVKEVAFFSHQLDEVDDSEYQTSIRHTRPSKLDGQPKRPEKEETSSGKRWRKDPALARAVLEKSNYMCEIDNSHSTFVSKTTGQMFMEAHHLIPMSKQGEFEFSLDVESNIVCLCPNCHRMFHHGRSDDLRTAIEQLHNERASGFKEQLIHISREDLMSIYDV